MTSYSNEARETLEQIRSFYPDLAARWQCHEDGFEFALEYAEQPGLAFPVALLFREDDTLQLEVPDFVAEYFPCGESEVRESFVDAACGLIEGRYRVVYFRRGSRILKSQLQVPSGSGWKRRSTHYAGLWALWPWLQLSEQAMQNVDAVYQAAEPDEVLALRRLGSARQTSRQESGRTWLLPPGGGL